MWLKSFEEFNKDKIKKLGFRYDCKACQKKHNDINDKKKNNEICLSKSKIK